MDVKTLMSAMTIHVVLELYVKIFQDISNASVPVALVVTLMLTAVFLEKCQLSVAILIHALKENNAFYTKEKTSVFVHKVFLVAKKLGYVKISTSAHSTDVHLVV